LMSLGNRVDRKVKGCKRCIIGAGACRVSIVQHSLGRTKRVDEAPVGAENQSQSRLIGGAMDSQETFFNILVPRTDIDVVSHL